MPSHNTKRATRCNEHTSNVSGWCCSDTCTSSYDMPKRSHDDLAPSIAAERSLRDPHNCACSMIVLIKCFLKKTNKRGPPQCTWIAMPNMPHLQHAACAPHDAPVAQHCAETCPWRFSQENTLFKETAPVSTYLHTHTQLNILAHAYIANILAHARNSNVLTAQNTFNLLPSPPQLQHTY